MVDRMDTPGLTARSGPPVGTLVSSGLYAWLLAAFSGATLLDIVYAGQRARGDPAQLAHLFAEASDFLLELGAVTLLAGLATVAAAWRWRTARFLLASSVIILALLLVAAPMASALVGGLDEVFRLGIGPWLRLGSVGLASATAFIGLGQVWRYR
jgi:hypothetical protein